jgi:hypothetical protein
MDQWVLMCSINNSNCLFIYSLCRTNLFSFTTNFMVVVLWCVSCHTAACAFSSPNWHDFLPHAETRYLAIRLRIRLHEYPIIKRENNKNNFLYDECSSSECVSPPKVMFVLNTLYTSPQMSDRISLQLIYSRIKCVRENLRVLLKQFILVEKGGGWGGESSTETVWLWLPRSIRIFRL